VAWIVILLAGVGYIPAAELQSASPSPTSASTYRTVLNQYCVTCHNERLRTAELLLDQMDIENVPVGAPVWEKVVRKLRGRAMPPAGMPRPDEATYEAFATYLETELDQAAEANPNPGRPPAHRLNRAEYASAIRDLLDLQIDGESLLPADDPGYGFDNNGAVLSVSPMLLERYLTAARKITSLAIGDLSIRPTFETYRIPRLMMQDDRMSDDLPFGSRGGIAVQHQFPLDGEYVVRIVLQRDKDERIVGLSEPQELLVLLDGEPVKTFTVGGIYERTLGNVMYEHNTENAAQLEYERTADANLEVRFPAKAGERLVGVTFRKETVEPEGMFTPLLPDLAYLGKGDEPTLASISIGGPYNATGSGDTASRRKIFVCQPADSNDEARCAREILSKLARSAYRRPVTEGDVRALFALYETGREEGDFEAGIAMALQKILVSPEFLFRLERDPSDLAPETAYQLSDLELASRLSFFLWSSIPDDELLGLAERGQLKDPAVLEQQIGRMLADSRSKALVENFAGQWLYLRNMRSVSPDPGEFPEFDDELREAFQRETELLFESMLREDRSVLDLLNADYTYVNERLARHYEIPNVHGSRFRRVPLVDEGRRGLLGQGSILTVTSYGNRTSPVVRGKWVLEQLLGIPPPPPPPDAVTTLDETGEGGEALTMRQQMEQHRANPVCSACHNLMDPIGFALENFDAIGKWRTTSPFVGDDAPIDASGMLYDGSKFQDVAEFREVLLSHPDQFARTVTEKLLTYALGRGLEYTDAPVVRKILRQTAPNDYRWSSLISNIVQSTPFQMRRSREP
jgi:mono/diheme cytochrome c family protein